MQTDRSQRWRERRQTFIPSATEINPHDYSVDRIDSTKQAKPFIQTHHYSGTYPASRADFGLFKNGPAGTSRLVGVACFSVPVSNASIPLHTGLAPCQGADLGRFVLLDEIPGNGETFFLSRAFRMLRREKPAILSIIAYSDPVRRATASGEIILPGHIGALYQVCGARYQGRSSPRTDLLLPNGTIFSPRAMSKIRAQDTGAAYAERQLLQHATSPRTFGESPTDWIKRLETEGTLQRRRHPNNHVYVFPLTRAAAIAAKDKPNLPYPVLDRTIHTGDVTALPLLANPGRPCAK